MAVTFEIVGDIVKFKGLSTDAKPTTYQSAGAPDPVPIDSTFDETDTKNRSGFNGDSWVPVSAGGADNSYETGEFANERNPGTANQYGVGVNESEIVVLDGVAAVAVSGGAPALLFGLHNNSTGVVTATIVGMLDQNGAARTQIYSLAANESKEFRGVKVGATFTITASVTQVLAVEWRLQ